MLGRAEVPDGALVCAEHRFSLQPQPIIVDASLRKEL
jgi:hypothetical protein